MASEIWEERIGHRDETGWPWHNQRGLTFGAGSENFSRGALGRDGNERQRVRCREPFLFGRVVAFEFRVNLRTGAHHSRRNSRDENLIASELSTNRIGETGERELARGIWRHMRHGDLAANRRNIHDASAAAAPHLWNNLRDQFDRRPKMQLHTSLEIFALHVLDRSD